MSDVLNRLKVQLKKAPESQRAIALATGISEAMLSRFLAGERELGIKNAERLADYFGMRLVLQPKRNKKRNRG